MTETVLEKIGPEPRIAVEHAGAGELALFLHGIGGNRANWRDQLAFFKREFHAAAWDARGYGDSDDYDGPLAFEAFAEDLLRVLNHFGAPNAHLIGLSMGGRIALDFHDRWPERVRSLVLCDTFPGYDVSFSREDRQTFVRRRKQPLEEGKEPRDIAPELARSLAAPGAPREVLDRLIASMSALRKDSYIKTIEGMTHYERIADLGNIRVPTLLVFGEEDRLTPPELGRRMHADIVGSEMIVVEGAGHLVNIEKPEEFNERVGNFLHKVERLARHNRRHQT